MEIQEGTLGIISYSYLNFLVNTFIIVNMCGDESRVGLVHVDYNTAWTLLDHREEVPLTPSLGNH